MVKIVHTCTASAAIFFWDLSKPNKSGKIVNFQEVILYHYSTSKFNILHFIFPIIIEFPGQSSESITAAEETRIIQSIDWVGGPEINGPAEWF